MILELQQRLREAGRIRIGDRGPKGNPRKLTTFRFTSRDRHAIDQAAATFGGQARPWDDQWEVVTDTTEIPVIVPPSDMAFSQFYEQWSGGGCLHRCDGAFDQITDGPCVCDPSERACSPHTRLSVMLHHPDITGLGLWRLDTQGWYAAQELAGAVRVAQALGRSGVFLPARLMLEQREQRTPGKPTRKFAVPVLDIDVAPGSLVALSNGSGDTATFTPVPALEAPAPSIAEQVAGTNTTVSRPARANASEPIRPTGLHPRPLGTPGSGVSEPGGGVTVPAGGTTPPSAPDDAALVVEQRAQAIARKARECGVPDDETRYRIITRVTDGRARRGHEVSVEDLPVVMAALVSYKRGELELEVGGVATGTPPTNGRTKTDWLARLDAVPGIGQARLLKRARDLAGELDLTPPNNLDEITDPTLVAALDSWLAEQ